MGIYHNLMGIWIDYNITLWVFIITKWEAIFCSYNILGIWMDVP